MPTGCGFRKMHLTQEVLKRELKPQTMVKQWRFRNFSMKTLELWKTPEYAEVEHAVGQGRSRDRATVESG